jgi:hypothetical protein
MKISDRVEQDPRKVVARLPGVFLQAFRVVPADDLHAGATRGGNTRTTGEFVMVAVDADGRPAPISK